MSSHKLDEGEVVSITTMDYRKWKRFWCWITRKPKPVIITTHRVGKVTDKTFFLGDRLKNSMRA